MTQTLSSHIRGKQHYRAFQTSLNHYIHPLSYTAFWNAVYWVYYDLDGGIFSPRYRRKCVSGVHPILYRTGKYESLRCNHRIGDYGNRKFGNYVQALYDPHFGICQNYSYRVDFYYSPLHHLGDIHVYYNRYNQSDILQSSCCVHFLTSRIYKSSEQRARNFCGDTLVSSLQRQQITIFQSGHRYSSTSLKSSFIPSSRYS